MHPLFLWLGKNLRGFGISVGLGLAITIVIYIFRYRYLGISMEIGPLVGVWTVVSAIIWISGLLLGKWR